MFSPSKILALVAIAAAGASASPLARADSPLTVEFTKPESSVSSIKDLVFTAKVTNSGAEDVKVLKYGTVLDSLPTRSFSIQKDGQDVAFNGVKVRFIPFSHDE
jgi:deuterolysin